MKNERFPLIAENVNADFYVCFTSENTGIVIDSTEQYYRIAETSDDWTSCFDTNTWHIIAQPSEYPKEMYVSDNSDESALKRKTRQTIVHKSHYGYITEGGLAWKYAVDIPEISEKEQKRNEILAKIDELYKSIEKL